jgi:predicted nicotinamide N-methyase
MRLSLLLALFFYCTFSFSQTSDELKNFIKKNNVAIRAVQKNIIKENSNNESSFLKDILKNQSAAVKTFKTDKITSTSYAVIVREKCVQYLKEKSQPSIEYYDFTSNEKLYKKTNSNPSKLLSESEIKTIESIDIMNPSSLNTIVLTIQE